MSSLRMTRDLRRELILGAAKRCFARNGFAGTTTKSVAAAAAISEGLLFKHFPSKSALYAEILAQECEADPVLAGFLGLPASTETLVVLIRNLVAHFLHVSDQPDEEEAQRLRLLITSQLEDGEFARLVFEKIASLMGPQFCASLDRAVAVGDAVRVGSDPMNLFWLAHQTMLMVALGRLPAIHSLTFGGEQDFERQTCEYILRGIGLNEAVIAAHLDRELSPCPARAENDRECTR
ncbi:TetR/AcrR family transcriptional regulator [Rhodopseudomonas telluris]|uniref:TetR/AcrR family transcriptional regulator n=1 Tax=Rhodopseudomonas telluris TaxID=644215 RepID=A0ABV6ETA0_9BRAD